jgi:hypothetical protein
MLTATLHCAGDDILKSTPLWLGMPLWPNQTCAVAHGARSCQEKDAETWSQPLARAQKMGHGKFASLLIWRSESAGTDD